MTAARGADKVILFPTCLVDIVRPNVRDAARRMLARLGFTVRSPRYAGCCGQPAWNAGYASDARRVATRLLRRLAKTRGPIVVPSGSCAAMLRHHWPELFDATRHAGAARGVAARTVELTSFCAERSQAPISDGQRVAYHASCHLVRTLGVREEPMRTLESHGYTVVEPIDADRCCGFGGTFAVKLPEISVAMGDEKLDTLVATGASTVAGCDLSCLAHLEARAKRRELALDFRHVAELCADD